MQARQMTAQINNVVFLLRDVCFSVFVKMLSLFLLTHCPPLLKIAFCVFDYTRVGARKLFKYMTLNDIYVKNDSNHFHTQIGRAHV